MFHRNVVVQRGESRRDFCTVVLEPLERHAANDRRILICSKLLDLMCLPRSHQVREGQKVSIRSGMLLVVSNPYSRIVESGTFRVECLTVAGKA